MSALKLSDITLPFHEKTFPDWRSPFSSHEHSNKQHCGRLYHELYEQDTMRREAWDSGNGRMLYVSLRYDFGSGKKPDQHTRKISGQDERSRM